MPGAVTHPVEGQPRSRARPSRSTRLRDHCVDHRSKAVTHGQRVDHERQGGGGRGADPRGMPDDGKASLVERRERCGRIACHPRQRIDRDSATCIVRNKIGGQIGRQSRRAGPYQSGCSGATAQPARRLALIDPSSLTFRLPAHHSIETR